MERRKFVIGLGSLAAGGAAALGTGAFSSVEADRSVEIEVADDADAYLRLEGEDGDNSDYVVEDGTDGTLELDLSGSNADVDGEGVNPNAVTKIDDLFTVENQGTQEVTVTLDKTGENAGLATFYVDDDYSNELDDTNLPAGESEIVSLEIDTEDQGLDGDDDILDTVTFNADA